MNDTPGAMKAMDDKFNKLSKQGVWAIFTVREKKLVRDEARRNQAKIHFGDMFGICGEKGSELKANDPGRKWKGRYVFRGDRVKDEYYQAAIFNELSSTPATLEASKAVDAYGLMPGHSIGQCDAEQAYVQSKLGGITTWVTLPRERWPDSFKGFQEPVVILRLS
eukprot:3182846-Heterocapsa_arctica.AAC.1